MQISLLHKNFDVTDKYIIDNTATMTLRESFPSAGATLWAVLGRAVSPLLLLE